MKIFTTIAYWNKLMCFANRVYHHHFHYANYATYQHFNPSSIQNVCLLNLTGIGSHDPSVI